MQIVLAKIKLITAQSFCAYNKHFVKYIKIEFMHIQEYDTPCLRD
jgi:hypothetical protein